MNTANKITISRIVLTIIIVGLLLFPFESAGVNFPDLFINELIVVNIKYLIAGFIFILALFTDFLDGYIAKKNNMVTDVGKILDNLADKMLIDAVLITLSSQGFLHPIIPVVIIGRDCVVNALRVLASKNGKELKKVKIGKAKNIILKVGITLTLFYNLPFELFNLNIADILLIVGTVLSVVSCVEYYSDNKKKLA